MLAALAFVGCSSDEGLHNGPEGNGTGYVAVNIVQPKSIGAKAAPDGYEYGTDEENFAKEGLFFILDEDGKVQTIDGKSSQRINLTSNGTVENHPVERVYSAVLVINGVTEDPTSTAKQIVCILNAPDGLEDGVTDLDELKGKVADYLSDCTDKGTFVMSNSVYNDGTSVISATPVTEGNIKTSASEALKSPVKIHVERVVAKVRAKKKAGGMTGRTAKVAVDGVEKSYTININGIALSNLTDKARLFKNIDDFTATWVWNDANLYRSYWELMPTDGITVNKKSWNEITQDSNYNSTAPNGETCFNQYILPNTFEEDNTCIVVAAQLVDNDNNSADLVWIRGGYTTDDGALKVIAAACRAEFDYYKKTSDNTWLSLEPQDFTWEKDNSGTGYNCHAKLKASFGIDNKIYDSSHSEVADGVNNVNNYFATVKLYHARKYTDGKSYYYVNIKHSDTGAPVYGIVRNHIYELTLNSINGIGVPVFDPDEINIPDVTVDDDLFFLGAEVNVLDWRIVSQGVDFN